MRLIIPSCVVLTLCLASGARADTGADPGAAAGADTAAGGASSASALAEVPEDAVAPEDAILERPAPDQGYYFSFGGQLAIVNVLDDGEWISGLSGNAFSLRIGQALTRWFDIGFRFDYGSVSSDGRSGTLGGFGLDLGLRPHGAWLIRGGLGMAVSTLGPAPDSNDKADTFGAVAALELGYSLFPFYESGESGSFAITPLLRIKTIQAGTDDSAYWAMLGLEITWWTGLPRNQLDLTLEEAFPE